MKNSESQTKQRILAAARALLQERGAEAATVRAIAQRAEVGIGLINYHFGSKDELLYQAVSSLIEDTAANWYEPFVHPQIDPETRLRQLIRESGRIVARFPKFFEISVRHELLEGEFNVPNLILPLLREIFDGDKRELELRLIAYSMIVSMQLALLRPTAFRQYTGLDLFEDEERDLALDILVNNVLAQRANRSKEG